MQTIYFDQLLDWVRGYKPKCSCGKELVVGPIRQKGVEGKEVYSAVCANGHTIYFEAKGRD